MKVLDLQCGNGHVFEGWFGGEDDYLAQQRGGLIQCPACADPSISKRLSVPRLKFSKSDSNHEPVQPLASNAGEGKQLLLDWLDLTRQVLASTTDVGTRFAQEARKMHYQETQTRSIRGTATREETMTLLDEGIEVLPLLLPEALKGTLQ
ncbi:MAG: DUF1178 family protein [Rhodoferax sp.]|nr:DUF1178 family protein [Rhodoferax sp.]